MKRWMQILCAAMLLLGVLPKASAAENRGSIQVKLDVGELPVIHGAVTLYQVGVKTEDGYRITEDFGGGTIRQDAVDSFMLAQWLAESADGTGMSLLLDADGNAVFSELEEGLYILVQTERVDGFYPIYPVLVTIPQESQWDVRIYREPVPVVTELPKTGDSPVLFLGILGIILSSAGLALCAGKMKKQ